MIARVTAAVACVGVLAACGGSASQARSPLPAHARTRVATRVPDGDWATFDYDAARTGVGPARTGITAASARGLQTRTVHIDGVADSSPIQINAVRVRGRVRDVVVVTTTYGHTIAFDPASGRKLWEFTPADIGSYVGTPQITTASPVLDPDRRYVYAASPDGLIHKLALATGRQVWKARITYSPKREKIEGGLNISGPYVIAATGGYYGDQPIYEGHVALLERSDGDIAHVWNAECSYMHKLIDPPSACKADITFGGSAILGRSGAIVAPGTHRLVVATGNGPFNGSTNWGDSVIELSPDATSILHTWTPPNQAQLNTGDIDLGSTEPALLAGGLELQGGKSGVFAVFDMNRQPIGKTGGALQTLSAPGGAEVFPTPAVWHHLVFVADTAGTAAYRLSGRRLHVAWRDQIAGTSPIVAGGLLYVYNEIAGKLDVLQPTSGRLLAALSAGAGHWSSPIVVGGRVILPVGGSIADNARSGTVFVYHLRGR